MKRTMIEHNKTLLRFLWLIWLSINPINAIEFPDLGGILDFSKPKEISNQLFILTNPKSGSHLLLYSIIRITKRPLRGRLPLELFYNDPDCYPPENILGDELDFSKPTTYWGHEHHLLKPLNRNQNKLIFIMRDYKENIISNVMLKYDLRSPEKGSKQIEKMLRHEIFDNQSIFQEFITRLMVYDQWDPAYRCLVQFDDLVNHPEYFVPQIMNFIEDDSDYSMFIDKYNGFKQELRQCYDRLRSPTGSDSDPKYFSKFVSPRTLMQIDHFVKINYPYLWDKYLYSSNFG